MDKCATTYLLSKNKKIINIKHSTENFQFLQLRKTLNITFTMDWATTYSEAMSICVRLTLETNIRAPSVAVSANAIR